MTQLVAAIRPVKETKQDEDEDVAVAVATATATASRYGGRGGGRSGSNSTNRVPKFKGNTEGMNGHVFQSHNENASKNQFLKTVEALSEYINKNQRKPLSTCIGSMAAS